MSAGLHRDLVTAALDNTLTPPGATTLLGTPPDLRKTLVDTYVVAASADHSCPWHKCYISAQLRPPRRRGGLPAPLSFPDARRGFASGESLMVTAHRSLAVAVDRGDAPAYAARGRRARGRLHAVASGSVVRRAGW
jgi:hypothetical protein